VTCPGQREARETVVRPARGLTSSGYRPWLLQCRRPRPRDQPGTVHRDAGGGIRQGGGAESGVGETPSWGSDYQGVRTF
jgi:hypothetical protein